MARASIKEDLIADVHMEYENLINILNQLDCEEDFDFEDRDRNPRDVIAHLYEWQMMFLRWYTEGCVEGSQPSVPKEGYTWQTIGVMNEAIRNQYQGESFAELMEKLKVSHQKILGIIDAHSNHDLYARNVYSWTNDSVLGSYISSAAPSHYEWASKKLKKQIRFNKKKMKKS